MGARAALSIDMPLSRTNLCANIRYPCPDTFRISPERMLDALIANLRRRTASNVIRLQQGVFVREK